MRPSRKDREAGKQPAEMPQGGAESPEPGGPPGTGEDMPVSCVGDDALAKLDALEKRLDELQETLDKLLPELGSAEGTN